MRTGARGDGEMKKSRRYPPYGDKSGSGRMYKNIVPAPPKELDSSSPVVSSPVDSRGPKRKRGEEFESLEDDIGTCVFGML